MQPSLSASKLLKDGEEEDRPALELVEIGVGRSGTPMRCSK